MMQKYKLLLIPVIIILGFAQMSAFAQQDMMLWGLSRVPQQRYVNPAFAPPCKFFIGIPAMSSNYFNYSNSGFRLSNLIKRDKDSLRLDTGKFLKNIHRHNYISGNVQSELITFGFRAKKNYFSFAVNEKLFLRATLPGDLFRFALEGNVQFIEKPANFSGLGLNMAHYREYAFTFTREIDKKLTIGGALKYLYGMENIRTRRSRIAFQTDPDNYALIGNTNILVQTSGTDSYSEKLSAGKYLFSSGNHGLGIDVGSNYILNEKVSFSASLIDLGFISWKNEVKNYYTNNTTFIYEGEDISKLINEEGKINYLKHFTDTIKASMDITESTTAYRSPINARFYLGGTYKWNEKANGRVLFFSEFYNKAVHPGLSLSVGYKLGKALELCGGYSIMNRGFFNIGLGATLSLGAFQWYMMTDNVFGMILPQHFRNLQLRTGFNLLFGRKELHKSEPRMEGGQ